MKYFFLPFLFLLSSCSSEVNFASKIIKGDSFFLCFPSSSTIYAQLSLEEKAEIQKLITIEKNNRNLVCDEYSKLTSAEENLKEINKQEMDRRLNVCRYRGEPCRYD